MQRCEEVHLTIDRHLAALHSMFDDVSRRVDSVAPVDLVMGDDVGASPASDRHTLSTSLVALCGQQQEGLGRLREEYRGAYEAISLRSSMVNGDAGGGGGEGVAGGGGVTVAGSSAGDTTSNKEGDTGAVPSSSSGDSSSGKQGDQGVDESGKSGREQQRHDSTVFDAMVASSSDGLASVSQKQGTGTGTGSGKESDVSGGKPGDIKGVAVGFGEDEGGLLLLLRGLEDRRKGQETEVRCPTL